MSDSSTLNKFVFWSLLASLIGAFCVLSYITYDAKLDSAGDNASYYILGESIASGEGYSNVHLPEGGAAKHYPPGYPIIIATAIALGFDGFEDIKLLNYILLAFSLFFVYLIARQVLERKLDAMVVTILCACNPVMLEYASMMMSEIPFLFFSLLALLALLKSEMIDGDSIKNKWFWLFVVTVIISFYIRSIAIAVLVGAAVIFIRRKNFQRLFVLVLCFAGSVVPWFMRNYGVEGSSYLQQLLMKNPLSPEEGTMILSDWPARVWSNLDRYLSHEFSAAIASGVHAGYFKDATALDYLAGTAILAITIFGLIKLPKGRGVLLTYFAATLAILLLWPDAWFGPRFLLPLVPLILIGVANTVYLAVAKTGLGSSARSYVIIVLLAIPFFGARSIAEQNIEADKVYTRGMQQLMSFGSWMKENAPEDAVVCVRKPELFFLFSDRKATRYKYTTNTVDQLKYFDEKGVDYLIFDALGYESTPKYLVPLIKKHQFKFFNIHQYTDPEAILFQFVYENGYNGEWEDGKKHGEGTFLWPNGDYYQGSWQYDLPNGYGALQLGDVTYVGEFGNGLKDGKGMEFDGQGNILRQGLYVADTLHTAMDSVPMIDPEMFD